MKETTPQAVLEGAREEFKLLWGEAPEGTLKWNKGNAILNWHTSTLQSFIEAILNEETLQHKYAKLNKNHSKYTKEVELVKGYNWAIDRLRVILQDQIPHLKGIISN